MCRVEVPAIVNRKEMKNRPESSSSQVSTTSQVSSEKALNDTFVSKTLTMKHVLLPIIAAALHMHVFYHALVTMLFTSLSHTTKTPSSVLYQNSFLLERAVFLAYTFDLISCYIFHVIPFSRCDKAKDIASHHLPILLALVPLGVTLWSESFQSWDPLLQNILNYHTDFGILRLGVLIGLSRSVGWGYISSFNEVIMCLQRAEMSLQGCTKFRNELLEGMKFRCFTSRPFIGLELYFKCGIFCMFGCFGFQACCSLDKVAYYYLVETGSSNIFKSMISSPMFIRAIIYRMFVLIMYPSMGLRTIKKIKQFHANTAETRRKKID